MFLSFFLLSNSGPNVAKVAFGCSGCLPFFTCLELSPCALRFFPYHRLDSANFASQPINHGDVQRFSCRMGVCCFLWYE